MSWYGTGRTPDLSLGSHTLAYCLHGASQGDADLYVMINSYWEELTFMVQEGLSSEWCRVVDTSHPSPSDFCEVKDAERLNTMSYTVHSRSAVILVRSSSQNVRVSAN